jgi:hypothetical protein
MHERVAAQVGRDMKRLSEEVEAARAAAAEASDVERMLREARLAAKNKLYWERLEAQVRHAVVLACLSLLRCWAAGNESTAELAAHVHAQLHMRRLSVLKCVIGAVLEAQVGRDEKKLSEEVEAARAAAAAKSADVKAREAAELEEENRLLRARLNGRTDRYTHQQPPPPQQQQVEDIFTVRKLAAAHAVERWTVSASTRALWGMLVGSSGGEAEASSRAEEVPVVDKAADSSAVGVDLRKKRKATVSLLRRLPVAGVEGRPMSLSCLARVVSASRPLTEFRWKRCHDALRIY